MAEYHVGCGFTGIWAGTLKKNGVEWQNKSLVTDEAISAVRDYLMNQLGNKNGTYTLEYKHKNSGMVITLALTIEGGEDVARGGRKQWLNLQR